MFVAGQQLFAESDPCAGSPVLRFTCDPWGSVNAVMAGVSGTLWSLIRVWWPLLAVVAVLALVAGALLARVVRLRRAREVREARFFEITPPYQLPADGAVPLWRLVASTLAQRPPRTRVALELWADPTDDGRIRAGLWVPGGGPAREVSRAIGRAWSGCGLAPAEPPRLPAGAVGATELMPREGPWAPLIDHQHRPERGAVPVEDEPLRAVLDDLSDVAAAGRFASVQVVVSPGPGRIDRRGRGAWGRRGLAGWIGAGLRGIVRGLLAVVDVLLSPSSSSSSRSGVGASPRRSEDDPVALARQRAREAKQKQGPHLRATVRLVVAGFDGPRAARRASGQLADELAALATDEHVTARRRVRRAVGKVDRYEHGRGFIASTRELAALWHLPHQPGSHGLPRPDVPHRKPDRALPRLEDYRHRRPTWERGGGAGRGRRGEFGGERDAA